MLCAHDSTTCFHVGCFWCVEAVYQRVVGVESVESGYMGGVVNNPSYGQVKKKRTVHAVSSLPYDARAFRSAPMRRQRHTACRLQQCTGKTRFLPLWLFGSLATGLER